MHWGGNWGTKNAVWVLLGEAKNRKRRGQKKENQLAAISIDGDHPGGAGRGGLRMIIERADDENLPV